METFNSILAYYAVIVHIITVYKITRKQYNKDVGEKEKKTKQQ